MKCSTCVSTTWSDRLISFVAVSALVGAMVSFYSFLEHLDAAPSGFCSFNETFDCDLVNSSSYAEIFGIPVALLGLIAYIVLFVGVMVYDRKRSQVLLQALLMIAFGGLVFSLYLTSVEAFILHAWCLLCLTSQAAILAISGGLFALSREAG